MKKFTTEEVRDAATALALRCAKHSSGVYSFEYHEDGILRTATEPASDWLHRAGYAIVTDRVISAHYKPWTQRVVALTEAGWEAVARLPGAVGKSNYATKLPGDISGSGVVSRMLRAQAARDAGTGR